MASGYLPNPANSVSSGELIAELSARAPKVGANTGGNRVQAADVAAHAQAAREHYLAGLLDTAGHNGAAQAG